MRPVLRFTGFVDRVLWALWVILLVTIPITSSPTVSALIGPTPVTPFSAVPLLGILVLLILTRPSRLASLPRLAIPLLAFAWVACLASALAPWLRLFPFKGQTILAREIRGIATLAIGLGFYAAAILLPGNDERLRASLRWITIGGIILLVWSSVQAFLLLHSSDPIPLELQSAHRLLSIRDMVRGRVTGLAYEPSWLADQLVMLYLPVWLACTLRRYSAFRDRRTWFSLEAALLLWGSAILFLSFSRIGLVAYVVVLGIVGIGVLWRQASVGARRLSDTRRLASLPPSLVRIGIPALGVVFLALAAGLTMVFAGRLDWRIGLVFQLDLKGALAEARFPVLYGLASRLAYAERVMYWVAASRVFDLHPLLGVGLGNSGHLFRSTVPAFGFYLPEIIQIANPGTPQFPNPKSLWLRLLAETGIVGFVLFAVWLLLIALTSWRALRSEEPLPGVVGLASGMALIALGIEGFSLDTFALPQLWILFGLLTSLEPSSGKRRAWAAPAQGTR